MSHFVPRRPTYATHYDQEPQIIGEDGAKTWVTRGQNFVIAVTEAKAGTRLTRADNPDEYMVVLPAGVSAIIETPTEKVAVKGDSLTIVPPGASTVKVEHPGSVLSIFSSEAKDLTSIAVNAAAYKSGQSQARPLETWPDPIGGFKVRVYDLSKLGDLSGELIQPRIFRSTNLMVNVFLPFRSMRPTDKLRPHWHDDFEQASVALSGKWIHHIRTPWSNDLTDWRPDEHAAVGSPSVTIIPETLIHATRNAEDGEASLIDVFSPPRMDFSQAGIVLNASDYPMPKTGVVVERDVPDAWRQSK